MTPVKQQSSFVAKEFKRRASEYIDSDDKNPSRTTRKHNVAAGLMARLDYCREAIVDLEKGFQEELCVKLQEAYSIADSFSVRKEAWILFCEDIFWDGCKAKKPKETDDHNAMISWVVRYVFQAISTEGARYNRAYKYWRTLQGYLRDGIPVEEVADRLMGEGLEYAFLNETRDHPRQIKPNDRKIAARPTNDKLTPVELDEAVPEPNSSTEDDDSGGDLVPRGAKHSQGAGGPKSRMVFADVPKGMTITIEVDDEQLDAAMASSVGKDGLVRFQHVETLRSGWKRFVATKLEIL